MYKFTYNVNSYYGRIVRVSDLLAGVSVVIRRDYRQHARHLTTMTTTGSRRRLSQSQRQQRCHVTTDSNGLLSSLTTPSSMVTRFSYVRATGLLASRSTDSGSELCMYKYGRDGRVTSVVYSTGETTNSDSITCHWCPGQLAQCSHSLHDDHSHCTYDAPDTLCSLVPRTGVLQQQSMCLLHVTNTH